MIRTLDVVREDGPMTVCLVEVVDEQTGDTRESFEFSCTKCTGPNGM